ncbi:GGDEF domain-containing protein [Alicyclobacillus tolerans]|uniref:diguanylate cyclase domain-containing protein n=1 Tax=Alicyclobacillus tolerans TaxID=90970 RepID=UPI001F359735|nr:sensor domain-containing diguanylate cyclase [Alicyclobacillus tolerans]MCF8566763.1 GGDEF domain-containing protein [Alicyclobacillus tolerans]
MTHAKGPEFIESVLAKTPRVKDDLPGAMMDFMSDMVFLMEVERKFGAPSFRYARMNPAAMGASGLNQDAYGAAIEDVVEPVEATFLKSEYEKAITRKHPVSFTLDHNGQIGESVLSPILDPAGRCTHVLGIVRDITTRYKREQELEYLAFYDELTGLYNRYALKHRVLKSLEQISNSQSSLSVLVIDCDDFKSVNDLFGHAVGDLLLTETAQRLRSVTRSEDTLVRMGGDEFLLLAPVAHPADANGIAERILHSLKHPWFWHGMSRILSVSIGIALFPLQGNSVQDVMQLADQAMYRAKSLGGSRYSRA